MRESAKPWLDNNKQNYIDGKLDKEWEVLESKYTGPDDGFRFRSDLNVRKLFCLEKN